MAAKTTKVAQQAADQSADQPEKKQLPVATTDLQAAGQIANYHAAQRRFDDYLGRKATNTVTAQRTDLRQFSTYLQEASIRSAPNADQLQTEPSAWHGVTWGIVDGFVKWQLAQGHAISSINRRLSTIKVYAKLASQAGLIDPQELALIKTVTGYAKGEAKRVDARRPVTRVGDKKSAPTRISHAQANQLKAHPDTPQGRRDALLMCLLLEHGLRVGEVVLLRAENFDLAMGVFYFDRPKVDAEQIHQLTQDTRRALQVYVQAGDAPTQGPLLRGSRKSGALTHAGISARAIQARVSFLGEQIGLFDLSPHDCRHYWATYWAKKVDLLRLQEAGGWSSLEMPRRYVERSQIANTGMTNEA
ncbi:MAG: tyrosine-type recombinase/integrase [Caldilineaceae bacterium]|nr:tyrosine-type recombinase/integrase [Caldilineaceae bacterium]